MTESVHDRYSALDRTLHHLAFRSTPVLADMAELEDRIFRKTLDETRADRPAFVTGLPRAGTTLLLRLLFRSGEFASHTYRDMPFLLVPLLWDRFASRFRTDEGPRPRAHGDGMLVGFDSPEAFEEILWKAFWSDHYRRDRIVPWEDEGDSEFLRFFRNHMRKIVALRRGDDGGPDRYVSKNNLNIARVGLLRRAFPDGVILVPFRNPVQQAASLLGQHLNFLEIHRENRFARTYMAAIGHFDFGENLRPVDFGGWVDEARRRDPGTLEFWIAYWIEAYRHLLGKDEADLRFVSYERLCRDPGSALRIVADSLGLEEPDALVDRAVDVKRPSEKHVKLEGVPPEMVDRARSLHEVLLRTALVA